MNACLLSLPWRANRLIPDCKTMSDALGVLLLVYRFVRLKSLLYLKLEKMRLDDLDIQVIALT